MRQPSRSIVRAVIAASVVSTAIHYTDNYVYVDDYPQPDYINREIIVLAWVLLTLLGVAGYLFFRDNRPVSAGLYLMVYSYTGLSSLGHYAFGDFGEFSTRMHVLIWMDGITGSAVAGCALWTLMGSRNRAGAADRVTSS